MRNCSSIQDDGHIDMIDQIVDCCVRNVTRANGTGAAAVVHPGASDTLEPRMENKRTPPLALVLSAAAVVGIMASAIDAQSTPGWINAYRETSTRLMKAATADDFAWQRLAELTDTYGNRLSGSENLTRAIAWAAETMKKDGLENVHTEKVMVPK